MGIDLGLAVPFFEMISARLCIDKRVTVAIMARLCLWRSLHSAERRRGSSW